MVKSVNLNNLLTDALGMPADAGAVQRAMHILGALACSAITVFILYTTAFGQLPGPAQYAVVLTLGMAAIFCFYPGPLQRFSGGMDRLLSILFIVMTVASGLYYLDQYQEIASLREGIPTPWDLACYAVGVICVLEAARRVEGWILIGVVAAAFIYMTHGEYMPGLLQHRPFWVSEVLEYSYSYQGIFGIALGAVVDVVFVFVILGVALRVSGAGDFFNFMAMRLTRGRKSGPAQCAIIASAMFGSINGSAPANVSATGVLTIPMMRRAGYRMEFAGGVEASASCVGQIMPPIMGVGAFIMSEITGIPYSKIMLAALVPAFLFIISLMIAVALQAEKHGIESQDDDADTAMTPERRAQAVTLVAGFATLIVLLFMGFSPTFCGLSATGVVLAVSTLFPTIRLTFAKLVTFIVDGGRDGIAVMIACAAIGIVIASFTSTGLGIKLNQMIVAVGGESLLMALILAAICSIVLGMGLPTAASYLMVVFVAGPAIMNLGVDKLQTHLFVFYYAVLSAITPPVALAVFAAAAIAKVSPLKLAARALRLSVVAFVLPVVWVYHPEINLQDLNADTWLPTAAYIPALLLAVVGATAGQIGYFKIRLNYLERVILVAASAAIVAHETVAILAGVAVVVAMLAFSWARGRRVAA